MRRISRVWIWRLRLKSSASRYMHGLAQRLRKVRHALRQGAPQSASVIRRGPATFLIEVPEGGTLNAQVLTAYKDALDSADDAVLKVWVADAGESERVRSVVDQMQGPGPSDTGSIQVLAPRDGDVERLREERIHLTGDSVGAIRMAYTRHQELDAVLAEKPELIEKLKSAANGHPEAAELEPVLDTFIEGYDTYVRTGETPVEAHVAMRKLSAMTDGALNKRMQEIHGSIHPPYELNATTGLLADAPEDELDAARRNIETDGFHVFSTRVPDSILDDLDHFARSTPMLPAPAPAGADEILFDGDQPVAPAYYLQPHRALGSPVLRPLYADTSMIDLAQRVLGCQPVVSAFDMWWTTPVVKTALSEIAQLYHFDMAELAFVKFFVYVTDVDEETGPHTLVRGSQNHKPMPLRRDGRITDRTMQKHYASEDIVEICGPRGTMFAVDTSAFHKGTPVKAGNRLVLQWEYASGLFGSAHRTFPLPDTTEAEFLETVQLYPRVFELVTSERHDLDSPLVGRWAVAGDRKPPLEATSRNTLGRD